MHTKGPWTFLRPANMIATPDKVICENIAPTHPRGSPEWTAEHEANARLIEAAPDMLAALQTLQRWIIPGTAAVFSEELVSDLGAVIKAAVNKATEGA